MARLETRRRLLPGRFRAFLDECFSTIDIDQRALDLPAVASVGIGRANQSSLLLASKEIVVA